MDFFAGMPGDPLQYGDEGLEGFFSSIGHFFSNVGKAVGQAGHDVIKAVGRSKVGDVVAPLITHPDRILPTLATFASTTLMTGNPIAGAIAAGAREYMGGNQIFGGSTMLASAAGSAGFSAFNPTFAQSAQMYANPLDSIYNGAQSLFSPGGAAIPGASPSGGFLSTIEADAKKLLPSALPLLMGGGSAGLDTSGTGAPSPIPYVSGGGGYGMPVADTSSTDTTGADGPASPAQASAQMPTETGGLSNKQIALIFAAGFGGLLLLTKTKSKALSKR
ncbi:MAG: hypothetical protein M0Z52_07315 [Actinomycetota bacterium]|nr:hypothetical protein [Actinomycetota bacterium]